jgi:TonB family protein
MKTVRALTRLVVPVAILALLPVVTLAGPFQSGEEWIEVRTKNFVVYTDTDEEKGVRLLERLESVMAAYSDKLFPLAPRTFPIRVLLFDDTDEYQRLLPERVRTERTLDNDLVAPRDAYLVRGGTDWLIAARDESPDDLVDDVGHSLGHLFLARSAMWQPFWLQEAAGEFVRLVGREDRNGDLDPDEAYAVGELIKIVPSTAFDDFGDGGPFRVTSYFLLRVLMENHPEVLDAYMEDIGLESGHEATLRAPAGEAESLDAKVRDFQDRVIPMNAVAVEPEVRDMSPEEASIVRGDLAVASGYPAVARGYYQQGGAAARTGMAVLGKQNGPSASNRRAFEELATSSPNDPLAHYHLGTLDPESGVDPDVRIASLARAAQLAPEFGRAHAELGWAYLARGQTDAAIDAANRAIALEPEHADRAFELLAEARFALGDIEGARMAMETAATLPHIDASTEEHYRLVVPDLYRRIASRERAADADRIAELRRQVEARADEVDPRPEVIPGGPAPYGLVHYEVTSTPLAGVQEPRLVSGDVPEYSSELRRNRVRGRADLELELDRQGRVISTRVVASDAEGLAEVALRAVEQWRFDPARSDGESIGFTFRIVFTFDLQE